MDRGYLTPKELCHRYKRAVSERTLANWRSKREGPAYTKIGGKVLYLIRDVIDWEGKRRILGELIKVGAVFKVSHLFPVGCYIWFLWHPHI